MAGLLVQSHLVQDLFFITNGHVIQDAHFGPAYA